LRSKIVLDSYAVLSLLFGEESGKKVKKLFKEDNEIYLNWNNLVEIYYIVQREESKEKATKTVSLIKAWSINLVEFDETIWLLAGDYKSKGRISFADAFAIATAKNFNAILVTGNPEFKPFEKEIKINWIG